METRNAGELCKQALKELKQTKEAYDRHMLDFTHSPSNKKIWKAKEEIEKVLNVLINKLETLVSPDNIALKDDIIALNMDIALYSAREKFTQLKVTPAGQ